MGTHFLLQSYFRDRRQKKWENETDQKEDWRIKNERKLKKLYCSLYRMYLQNLHEFNYHRHRDEKALEANSSTREVCTRAVSKFLLQWHSWCFQISRFWYTERRRKENVKDPNKFYKDAENTLWNAKSQNRYPATCKKGIQQSGNNGCWKKMGCSCGLTRLSLHEKGFWRDKLEIKFKT